MLHECRVVAVNIQVVNSSVLIIFAWGVKTAVAIDIVLYQSYYTTYCACCKGKHGQHDYQNILGQPDITHFGPEGDNV